MMLIPYESFLETKLKLCQVINKLTNLLTKSGRSSILSTHFWNVGIHAWFNLIDANCLYGALESRRTSPCSNTRCRGKCTNWTRSSQERWYNQNQTHYSFIILNTVTDVDKEVLKVFWQNCYRRRGQARLFPTFKWKQEAALFSLRRYVYFKLIASLALLSLKFHSWTSNNPSSSKCVWTTRVVCSSVLATEEKDVRLYLQQLSQ